MTSTKVSSLERLPPELLEPIVDDLCRSNPAAPASLLSCSQHLKRLIEPMLYTRREIQNQALQWACIKGNTDIIRLLVSYGAPVNTYFRGSRYQSVDSLFLFSLCLAAKHRRVEAFRLLLELGARVDRPQGLQRRVQMAQLRQLVNYIFSRTSIRAVPELARLFFEGGLDVQIKEAGQAPDVYHPFIRFIKAGAPTELVQLLLDGLADPNCVQADFRSGELISALSAAAIANSPATFRLLIARGARIHGPQFSKPTTKALHLPVFAAAHAMAVASTAQGYNDSTAIMRLCLDSGADINQRECVVGTPRPPHPGQNNEKWRKSWLRCDKHYDATPLYIFLDSSTTWKTVIHLDGLSYLLSLGSTVNSPGRDCDHVIAEVLHAGRRPKSPLELLLEKYVPQALAGHAEYLTAVRCLLQHGGARKDHAYLLARFTIRHRAFEKPAPEEEHVIADLLVSSVPRDEASEVLWWYVVALGQCFLGLGDPCRAVVQGLVDERGADVNASFRENAQGEAEPALHHLCRLINHLEKLSCQPGSRYTSDVEKRLPMARQYILQLLLSRGADPGVLVGGKTAFDLLHDGLDKLSKDSQEYLQSRAAVLRGECIGSGPAPPFN